MKSATVVLLVMLMGCSTSMPPNMPAEQEQVEAISMAPLPPLSPKMQVGGITLDVMFHIQNDGTVLDAKMLRTSGDAEWDSLAIRSMRQWRFAVPAAQGAKRDLWVRHKVIVQVQEPMVMTIGELVCASRGEADSLYALVVKGTDFWALAMQAEQALSPAGCRCPGAVEIARYPRHVREKLRTLRVNDVTVPLRLGSQYVIYKRFPDQMHGKASEE